MSIKNAFLFFLTCFIARAHAVYDISQIRKYFSDDGTRLEIIREPIGRIDGRVFEQIAEQFPRLRILNLPTCHLTELPEGIGKLTQLKHLELKKNELTCLPKSISKLVNLEYLDLSENQICYLPESIGNLTQLYSLYLHGNQLHRLPESIGRLTQLQTLVLSDNQLKRLPESISNLTQLQLLWAERNLLTQLPEGVSNLTKLERINMAENRLTNIRPLQNLMMLKKIGLEDNPVVARADWPETKRRLGSILYDTPLPPYMLPWSITDINQILYSPEPGSPEGKKPRYDAEKHTLDLSNAPIESILPEVFEAIADLWPDLEVIDLTNTPITKDIRSCSELRNGLYRLKELNTHFNKIIIGDAHLIIDKNSAASDDFERWTTPTHITSLSQIKPFAIGLSDEWGNLVISLAKLDLESIDGTVFTQIADECKRFGSISIDLGYNPRLDCLPDEITQVKSITSILLNDTGIKALPKEFHLMPNLDGLINLDHTPLVSSSKWKRALAYMNYRRKAVGLDNLLVIDHAIPTEPLPVSADRMASSDWRKVIATRTAQRKQLHLVPFKFYNPAHPDETWGELFVPTPEKKRYGTGAESRIRSICYELSSSSYPISYGRLNGNTIVLNLEELDAIVIDGDLFTNLADKCRHFSQKISLDLSRNPRLTILPNEITQIKNLREILLNDTGIRALPEGLHLMPELRSIHLNYTPLVSAPEWKHTFARINSERKSAGLPELIIHDRPIPTAPIRIFHKIFDDPEYARHAKIERVVKDRKQLHLVPFQYFDDGETCGELYVPTPDPTIDKALAQQRIAQIHAATTAEGAIRALTLEECDELVQLHTLISSVQWLGGESESAEGRISFEKIVEDSTLAQQRIAQIHAAATADGAARALTPEERIALVEVRALDSGSLEGVVGESKSGE